MMVPRNSLQAPVYLSAQY